MYGVYEQTYLRNADGTLSKQQGYYAEYFENLEDAQAYVQGDLEWQEYRNGEVVHTVIVEVG